MEISRTSRHLAVFGIALSALLLTACTTPPASKSPWAECTAASELDAPTKVLRRGQPRIQAEWFPEGQRFLVTYTFEVTPEGKIGRKLYKPAEADPRIIKAIERSFSQWRFKPGTRNGLPVATCFEQPYDLIFERITPEETEK